MKPFLSVLNVVLYTVSLPFRLVGAFLSLSGYDMRRKHERMQAKQDFIDFFGKTW